MSTPLHQPAGAPSPEGLIVDVTPAGAGWEYSALKVLHLEPGQVHTLPASAFEWIVLPLAGRCTVTCGSSQFELEGRASVFERVTDFAYVPRDSSATIHSDEGGRFALPGARAENALAPRHARAEDVPVELRGAGSASRQANNFASPEGFETDRLISVEVLVPGGNWASYPPHKHDEERPGEARLEEIYYFEVRGGAAPGTAGPGGYQRVYSSGPDRHIDVLAEVSTGDTVLIPYGYHGPTMAAPGYDLYFLNVLAGASRPRTMAFCDDPAHAWVRASWRDQAVDPRLPLATHRGPS
ncbi:MAG: 5-deoxy-glucuronate isomerase [Acidobacteriota bacterium]|nr:5-deoxy-glucuronate isomerase [Acidobacteriota bacterium]